ncbi:MAG: hypothetical protein ACFE9T_03480 [Promethearchaeota archaeon]
MSDQISLLLYIKTMLADLIYINGVIATELIKVTENTATIRHGEEFLRTTNCLTEHQELNEKIIEIVKKYKSKKEDFIGLERHVMKHQNKSE